MLSPNFLAKPYSENIELTLVAIDTPQSFNFGNRFLCHAPKSRDKVTQLVYTNTAFLFVEVGAYLRQCTSLLVYELVYELVQQLLTSAVYHVVRSRQ